MILARALGFRNCMTIDIGHMVPGPRLARYARLAGPDPAAVEVFYQWAQELSLAFFADISTLEVAMRSAMARELSRQFGNEWYAQAELFDDDCQKAIVGAWGQAGLGKLRSEPNVDLEVVEGKLVASLMFGFWVQLLGKGSYAGKGPFRERRIYDSLLWRPALTDAFPGQLRVEVQRAATVIRVARNRVAHHEHLAWGMPLPGQNRRLTVSDAHSTLIDLAGFLSGETVAWILQRSSVRSILGGCPVDTSTLLL